MVVATSVRVYHLLMLRINPRGRSAPVKLLHVGRLGERVHGQNPDTGLAFCAPNNLDVRPARGDQVTCYRCQKLMAINRSLRGKDFAVGGDEEIVAAAAARKGRG